MQITYRTCKCEIRLEEHIRIWCRNMMVIVSNIWPPETGDERRRTEKNYEQMRSDNGRAHSPRCSIQMPKIFLRNDLKNLHKCIKKKHPEQVKTDLTNLKVFWTFRRLDCTNSKGFSRVKKLKKISTCVTPRYLHRQYSKLYTSHQFTSLDSSIYWTLAMNDCYCRRSSYSPDKASPSFVILLALPSSYTQARSVATGNAFSPTIFWIWRMDTCNATHKRIWIYRVIGNGVYGTVSIEHMLVYVDMLCRTPLTMCCKYVLRNICAVSDAGIWHGWICHAHVCTSYTIYQQYSCRCTIDAHRECPKK